VPDQDKPRRPRVLCIHGNPKERGFVHACVDHIADRLEAAGVEVDRLRLRSCELRDCLGCFNCLRTGQCAIDDDMAQIIERIRLADGLVTGASVRNGLFPALFKLFYERLTYIVGFGRDLRGKYILAVGAVGMAGGRKPLGRLISFREFHTYLSDYLFFRTGIPTRLTVEDVSGRLDRAADRFRQVLADRPGLPWRTRLMGRIDDFIVRRFMLRRNPDRVYDYVIAQWREKGLL
jgi:multimeric flavodoxin WrbA